MKKRKNQREASSPSLSQDHLNQVAEQQLRDNIKHLFIDGLNAHIRLRQTGCEDILGSPFHWDCAEFFGVGHATDDEKHRLFTRGVQEFPHMPTEELKLHCKIACYNELVTELAEYDMRLNQQGTKVSADTLESQPA